MTQEDLVKHINRIIQEAIEHGGDDGGAYFCNAEGLKESMEAFKQAAKLDDYTIEMCDGPSGDEYFRYRRG